LAKRRKYLSLTKRGKGGLGAEAAVDAPENEGPSENLFNKMFSPIQK